MKLKAAVNIIIILLCDCEDRIIGGSLLAVGVIKVIKKDG